MLRFGLRSPQMDGGVPYTTATLLLNPYARRAGRFDVTGALHYLRRRGLCVRLAVPTSVESMRRAAREAAEMGDDLLFVVGGDGSLRVAAGELAGSSTALAAVPAGTADVWCREVGIPRRFRLAIDAHLSGQTVEMDLGRVNGEPFLLMAGFGWDAQVAHAVDPFTKRLLGPAAYVLYGLVLAPRLRRQALACRFEGPGDDLPFDGQRPQAAVVFSNTRLYGGVVELTPAACANDGLLDIWSLSPLAALRAAWNGVRRWMGKPVSTSPGLRARRAQVEAHGVPIQLDGDPAGATPASVWVEPRALRVSIPAGPLPLVFRSPEDATLPGRRSYTPDR